MLDCREREVVELPESSMDAVPSRDAVLESGVKEDGAMEKGSR